MSDCRLGTVYMAHGDEEGPAHAALLRLADGMDWAVEKHGDHFDVFEKEPGADVAEEASDYNAGYAAYVLAETAPDNASQAYRQGWERALSDERGETVPE